MPSVPLRNILKVGAVICLVFIFVSIADWIETTIPIINLT